MEKNAVSKATPLINVEIIEYVPESVMVRTILKKATGIISAVSFDTDEAITGKIIPFDTFIQIIDGKAEVIIDGKLNSLTTGESIVIPAHSSNVIKASQRFKMIKTIIKNGYEDYC